jgi:hypothetical protein
MKQPARLDQLMSGSCTQNKRAATLGIFACTLG